MSDGTDGKNRVRDFIVAHIEAKGKLPPGCDIDAYDYRETGAIDSMALIKFLMELEMEFDVTIADEDMLAPGFTTVGGLTDLVFRKTR